jgi:phospholipid/cholesterol/gamma-HCH transport system substrate-binding protein
MSKKANPIVIGVFIIAGVALGVAGLIVFSSGNLFSKKHKYILYFEGSMKGMNKGAPVQLKGVTIGSVVDVYISHNEAPDDHSSPVIIEIDEQMLHTYTDRRVDLASKEAVEQLVAKGLRGKLDAASFITGVLMVELDIIEDAPPPVYHQIKPEYLEIPTMPTTIQMLLANIGKFDIKGMGEKLNSILAKLDSGLGNLDVKAINAGVTNLLASLNQVVSSPELSNSIISLHHTLDDFGALAKNIDTNTLVQLQTTLADLRVVAQGMSTMVAPDSPLQTELVDALSQISNAARSIAELTEFLKRNPDALITGRNPPKEKP